MSIILSAVFLATTSMFCFAQEKPTTPTTVAATSTLMTTTAPAIESAAAPADPFIATRVPPNWKVYIASFKTEDASKPVEGFETYMAAAIRKNYQPPALISMVAINTMAPFAQAPKEIPPPQGKGRVVVVSSGASGMDHYETVSRAIAALGYDVVLYDGNSMVGTRGAALKDAIQQALQMPHALPGKVALVGFSLGGGISLAYGTQWPDQVAVVIVWYPLTSVLKDIPGLASRLKVPVLMFAGESDTYKDCCLIGTARSLAAAATAANQPFELFTYPKTDHDFVQGGSHYNPSAYKDALDKTAAKLKVFLGN